MPAQHDWGSGISVPDATWTYVTFRYDDSGKTGYMCASINGNTFKCGGKRGAFNDKNDDIILGHWEGNHNGRAFSGKMAYPEITKALLTEKDIERRMKRIDVGCTGFAFTSGICNLYTDESDKSECCTGKSACSSFGNDQTFALAIGPGSTDFTNLVTGRSINGYSESSSKMDTTERSSSGIKIPDYIGEPCGS